MNYGGRMWSSATGTSGGPHMGHEACEGCSGMSAGDACGTQLLAPSAERLWCRETSKGLPK
eukprot:9477689-Pyramimonas_sp.AAC.1